jgi:hypothetical protein
MGNEGFRGKNAFLPPNISQHSLESIYIDAYYAYKHASFNSPSYIAVPIQLPGRSR